jgi:hypothetical protein
MYPISFEADPALEGRNRLTSFFRLIVGIPWYIVAYIYGIVAALASIVAWFAIVFTGKYPQGIYDFNAGYLRMSTRANGFIWLLTDEYPPFGGEEGPDYPIRVGIAPPLDHYSRLKTGFRFILAIPVAILWIVWAIILEVCAIIGWFAILFTGKLPEGLFNPMRSASAYYARATAYATLLMTETWPPFSYEEGGTAPAGQISSETAPPPSPEA